MLQFFLITDRKSLAMLPSRTIKTIDNNASLKKSANHTDTFLLDAPSRTCPDVSCL